MDNTIAGWHDAEVLESGLTPLEEGKALFVAIELDCLVLIFSVCCASDINLNRVINDQIRLAKRVDLVRITTEVLHGCSHGGQVDDGGHASEVLEEDARRLERDLDVLLRRRLPVEDGLDIRG